MAHPRKGQRNYRLLIMHGLLLGLTLVWFAGCSSLTSGDGVPRTLEADYGRSVTFNRLEMMVQPPDAVDGKPPVGMTPVAAKNVQDRYDKSFKDKEKPAPVIQVIGAQ
ncbi:MAG: hypothetical protein ACYDIC_15355 [Desulfobaccales bacterium]